MQEQKGFTLVELLVAMAIIAILIGMAVFGINVVQQNARDTQRRAAVSDIEIALNSEIVAGRTLNTSFDTALPLGANQYTGTAGSITIGSTVITLNAPLTRADDATAGIIRNSSTSDFCYAATGNTYVVGVALETGGFFYKTNSGNQYTSSQDFTATSCTDGNL
jgi:prepilin-type N-terminal cleavage/methylation domain-containing protein